MSEQDTAYRTSAKPPPEKMYYLAIRVYFVDQDTPFEYRLRERPKAKVFGHLKAEQETWENTIRSGGTMTRAGNIINTKNVTRVEVFPQEVESEDAYY
jgi:hypothetical protein